MEANTTSVQFTAAYGSTMVKTKPGRIEYADLANAKNVDYLKQKGGSSEDYWKTTETVAEDGTITRTISGSSSVCSVNTQDSWRGTAAFSVSISFHPDTYEGGELGATADLLAAARAAEQAAIRSTFSGEARDNRLQVLDDKYETRKKEAADSFADMVSGFLEASHPTGEEKEKVRKSVYALFASAEARYQKVIEENDQKSWMEESLSASVVNLRRLAASVQTDAGKSFYSLQELEFTAMRVCRGFEVTF